MYKLMILIPPFVDDSTLDEGWPEFLRHAEMMPGLQREATAQVEQHLIGDLHVSRVHELYFESRAALQSAMRSPAGMEAGRVLQQITRGQVTLLIARHNEDSIENLMQYRQQRNQTD
jgi:hypothetical protein